MQHSVEVLRDYDHKSRQLNRTNLFLTTTHALTVILERMTMTDWSYLWGWTYV
jgi:hypothetical protein